MATPSTPPANFPRRMMLFGLGGAAVKLEGRQLAGIAGARGASKIASPPV